MEHGHYHLHYYPPAPGLTPDPWPRGAWAVYRINGDEIARRIQWDGDNVVRRDSWPGYLGMTETLQGVQEIITKDMQSDKRKPIWAT